jgi:hypothetical protein
MPTKRKREVTISSMTAAIERGDASWINDHLRNQAGMYYNILFEGMFPYYLQGSRRLKGSAPQLAIVCALRNPDEWSERMKIVETLLSVYGRSSRNQTFHDRDTLNIIFKVRSADETVLLKISEILVARADLSVALVGLTGTIEGDFPKAMKLWLRTYLGNGPGHMDVAHVLRVCVLAKHERAVTFFRKIYKIFCKRRGHVLSDCIVLHASRNDSPHAAPLFPMLLDELNVSPQRFGKIMLHELGLRPHDPIRKAKLEVLRGALYRTDPVNLVAYAIQAVMGGFYGAGEDRSGEKRSMLSVFELGVVQMIVRCCLE